MSDLIDRQAAIEAVSEWLWNVLRIKESDGQPSVFKRLRSLPSAELGTNLAEVGTDCISRQAAIDALKKQREKLLKGLDKNSNVYGIISASTGIVICTVGQLPSAQSNPHWIPVTEKLPEVGREILFCDIDGDIFVGHRATEHWWSVDDKVKNVTAWMPLPEPYKGVTE